MLIAPFKSIRDAAEHLTIKFISYFLKDIFRNIDKIGSVHCPLLIIHGKIDNLIPITHSEDLIRASKSPSKHLESPNDMNHNDMDVDLHVIKPFKLYSRLWSLETGSSHPIDVSILLLCRLTT